MRRTSSFLRLLEAALIARRNAYCPYSRYVVGASVMTNSGDVFYGCNVENASYGLSLCAERAAVFNAVAHGHKTLKAVCVVSKKGKPCGACRQVLFEFSTAKTALYIIDMKDSGRYEVRKTTVFKLLPEAFDLWRKKR